ncbi:MAG: NFACT RNA binding domain-containing protein [Candidatus Micrarchaeaceae archaeon]
MEAEIDFTISAQRNADAYYKKAKKLAQKREGAQNAIAELGKKLEEVKKRNEAAPKHAFIKATNREWYEKFHWFTTSEGFLVIGGRDSHQNEMLNARYFEEGDLFFHADIFGASAVILKKGVSAGAGSKSETAQFAACYSSAWERMLSNIDVYAVKRDQVSKSTNKGSLGAGSFLLKGEREWFRNMKLELVALVKEGKLNVLPREAFDKMNYNATHILVRQGKAKKSDAAKAIANALSYADIDEIMRCLPAGSFEIQADRQFSK